MNISESFAQYLENTGIATLGQNMFIGEAPSSNQVTDAIWWITSSGGNKAIALQTGEAVKVYQLNIYYRNRSGKVVYDALQSLEEQLNCDGCTQLEGYDTIDIEAMLFPVDQDIDSEDRKVGLLQANITIFKEC